MTARATRHENWKYADFILQSGEVARHGGLACIDTSAGNEVVAGQVSTTLLPIGTFDHGSSPDDVTGDGVALVTVRMFRELDLEWLDNDVTNPVLATDLGSECYILDDHTVSISDGSSARSKAGRVWQVSSRYGVLVEAGPGVTGPTGATGVGPGVTTSRTTLAAIAAANRYNGQEVTVLSDTSHWIFDSAASFTSDENGMIGVTPSVGTGRWVRTDPAFIAKLPFTKDTTDAAPLLTVPTGFAIRLGGMPFWDVVTGFTGGSNSAIGVSASAIATTKGDLLGGASGQLTAVLGTAGIKAGTIGPLFDTLVEQQAFFLKAADFLRADLIASQYAAGAGFACFPMFLHRVG